MKVILDPGHGKDTPGKRSPDGRLLEWKWARETADAVKCALCRMGIEAASTILPEDGDADVPLSERCRRANAMHRADPGGCLLVSLHVNASGNDGKWHKPCGWSVYVSPNASQASRRLARSLYAEADRRGLRGDRCVPKEGYWTQSLAMCRDTLCPAVLVENMFQDNKEDCDYLLSEKGRSEIASLLAEGIANHIKSL